MLPLLQPIPIIYPTPEMPLFTLTISPTFYLASNGVTIKCSGCSAGDTGMVSGTIYTAAANSNISNHSKMIMIGIQLSYYACY